MAMPHREGFVAEITSHAPSRGKHPAGDWDTNNLLVIGIGDVYGVVISASVA